ncbi:MAG: HIT domain-containing protein [Desulfofustis sp.]
MKALWTPWRMEHVLGTAPHPSHCLFEPEGDQPHSRKLLVLYRDSGRLCLLNRFPYTNGHLLVAPVRHAACVTDLEPKELHEVNDLVQQATQILREELAPDGFNIGLNLGRVAGAGIDDHLHYHIVPRWQDDHNFMTVLAEIRTIPEHLETTYDRLLPHFQRLYRVNHS